MGTDRAGSYAMKNKCMCVHLNAGMLRNIPFDYEVLLRRPMRHRPELGRLAEDSGNPRGAQSGTSSD